MKNRIYSTPESYEIDIMSISKDLIIPSFEEKFPISKTKQKIFVEEQKNNGIKVASVYLPKRVINPEENKTDVNDFFNSLDGISIFEIKR